MGDLRPDVPASISHPVRVAFVLHVMQVAGAEVLVAETIRRLGRQLQPLVVCLDALGDLGAQLRAEGVEVIVLDRKPGLDLGVAARLAREVRRRGISVVHAHQYTPFFYSALARVMTAGRFRLIFTEHGRHYPDRVARKRRLANRWVFSRLADVTTAVCAFSGRALREIDGFTHRPVQIIENGIDVARYGRRSREAARRAVGLEPGRRYIGNVARLHPVKDHATLLEAFRLVASACPDVDLLLAGDGPLRPALEEHARRLSLERRVRFLGVRHDVPDILAAVDVFCLTSVSEAASLTLLEAMASGVPVVVTNVGGNPEIVRDGIEGFLVPRGDAASVSAALLRVLTDAATATRLGHAGAARVRQAYRLEATIDRYHDLFRQVQGA